MRQALEVNDVGEELDEGAPFGAVVVAEGSLAGAGAGLKEELEVAGPVGGPGDCFGRGGTGGCCGGLDVD